MLSRTIRSDVRVDLRLTLAKLGRGPCGRFEGDTRWWATRTPDGGVTARISAVGDGVRVDAWGPGAESVLERAAEIVGYGDEPALLVARHRVLREAQRRLVGLLLARPSNLFETLVPVILEQRVQTASARRSYGRLVRRWGEPAPGPGSALGLMLPPTAATLAHLPSYALHPLDVERKRAESVVLAARVASRLEEAAGLPGPAARARLQIVPGVGPWTSAEVALYALGDPDAVPVGDYHLPNTVCWALAGEARGDDARMLALLEPYRGQRGRVIRLLGAAGVRAPAFGPRTPRYSIARV